ncbi:MAG: glycoside hydrolase family 127 protein, partial [Abditibacteriota bacterium]|nr:glycoside hydrolase family 127 protein [Abditibacteriota bacterium]
AMSEDGSRYFYVNPLESDGGHHRSGWFGCSCCPPNIARLIADLGEYIYGVDGKAVYIHQYIGCAARIGATDIEMDTDYPFEDTVRIKASGGEATLYFRLPSWCGSPSCVINGKETPLKKGKNGYVSLKHKGESEIVLTFPMDIVFNTAHPAIEDDRNKLCVTCGPLVYCAEETDNGRLDALAVIKGGAVKTDKALFGKYPVIRARGFDLEENKERELSLIPYYLWDNREPGAMKVWIPEYKE